MGNMNHGQPIQPVSEDMGAEADDEEGEEESEEEDTDEEGMYGPQESQEDEISDDIEDEAATDQWASHPQHANSGTQYRQPGKN